MAKNPILKFKLTEDDVDTLVICAFRYALGRETYIVDDVAGIIESNLTELSNQTIQVLLQDFERQHDYEELGAPRVFGASFDKERWMLVEDALKAERIARKEDGRWQQ